LDTYYNFDELVKELLEQIADRSNNKKTNLEALLRNLAIEYKALIQKWAPENEAAQKIQNK
ncbi:34519_t:CDS:1, partial [Gigaspora margarita]